MKEIFSSKNLVVFSVIPAVISFVIYDVVCALECQISRSWNVLTEMIGDVSSSLYFYIIVSDIIFNICVTFFYSFALTLYSCDALIKTVCRNLRNSTIRECGLKY